MPRLTVVIPTRDEPTREWEEANISVRTLRGQTFRDMGIVTVWDAARRGACWARNVGFSQVNSELVLFSDDDINWMPDAIETMVRTLDANPGASYVYGAYRANWTDPETIYTIGDREFDATALRRKNYISTMSVIRAKDFPGFDEDIQRLQDWALWLRMLKDGRVGAYCGRVVFETVISPTGVTFGSIPWEDARTAVVEKYA